MTNLNLDGTKIALPQHAERLRAYAWAKTPTPGYEWRTMTPERRLLAVDISFAQITVKDCKPDGSVIVELWDRLSASERGEVLLDYEEALKQAVDRALTVWLAPLGDRNSLRNLRGIEIKS